MIGDGESIHLAREIEYSDRGSGEPIVLVHAGVFADWFVPLALSPSLDGFQVIRVRRAGYSKRTRPSTHLSIGAHAKHCATLLDTLGVGPAHVVGHSSGALIALELAADRPDLVRSLVLVEPAAAGGLVTAEEAEFVQGALGPVLAAAAAGDIATAFDGFMMFACTADYRDVITTALGPDALRAAQRESEFFFADELAAVLEWSFGGADAARVAHPTAIVHGRGEAPSIHEVPATRLAGWLPNGETMALDGADHMLPLRDPETLGRLVARFAKSV